MTVIRVVALPPPGAGFVTTMGKVPGSEISPDWRVSLKCPGSTRADLRGMPLKLTFEVVTKFFPAMVNSACVIPAASEAGDRDCTTGMGLAIRP